MFANSWQVKKNLRVMLCCSPVGDRFRTWARQFPALVNCTVTNTFTECVWHSISIVSCAHTNNTTPQYIQCSTKYAS